MAIVEWIRGHSWQWWLRTAAWGALILMAWWAVAQLCGLVPPVWDEPWAAQMAYGPLLLAFPLAVLVLVVYRRRWRIASPAIAFLLAMLLLIPGPHRPFLYGVAAIQLVPLIVFLVMRIPHMIGRLSVCVVLALSPLLVVSYVAHAMDAYFTPVLSAVPQELYDRTANGRRYTHDTLRRDYESGRLVWVNVCDRELEQSWDRLIGARDSLVPWKQCAQRTVLVHYLTSKGLRKDSVGMSLLSSDELEAIAHGTHHWRLVGRWAPYRFLWGELEGIDRYRMGDTTNVSTLVRSFLAVQRTGRALQWWPWSEETVWDKEWTDLSGEWKVAKILGFQQSMASVPTPLGFINLAAQIGLGSTLFLYIAFGVMALFLAFRRRNWVYLACAWWAMWVIGLTASGASWGVWMLVVCMGIVLFWRQGELYQFWGRSASVPGANNTNNIGGNEYFPNRPGI